MGLINMELDVLYNQDCIKGLQMLPDKCVDLTVTSPPYDNLRTYNGNIEAWNFEKFQCIAEELFRVTKDGGVVVWIVNDAVVNGSETGTSFRQALFFKKIGFNLHDTMIWEKDSFSLPDKYRYRSCFEYMFVLSKGRPKVVNLIADRPNKYAGTIIHGTNRAKDGSTFRKSNDKKTSVKDVGVRFNVWKLSSEKQNKTGHPAVFPEQVAKDHIISWSDEGDIVLDPFVRSGTTAVACVNSNRHYIGFEIDDHYFDIACERLDSAKRDKQKLKWGEDDNKEG